MSIKKKCFIITPIGDDSSAIRRHIDGVIDASIIPALGEKYDIIVSHRMYKSGTITKQIITEICNDDLVIANITDRNPNVMYELAIRHSIGKPVIMIAEKNTTLPADIIMERTVFYKNDAQGVIELTKLLKIAEEQIDYKDKCGPLYDVFKEINRDLYMLDEIKKKSDESETNQFSYLINRLDKIDSMLTEKNVVHNNYVVNVPVEKENLIEFICKFNKPPKAEINELSKSIKKCIKNIYGVVDVTNFSIDVNKRTILIDLICLPQTSNTYVCNEIIQIIVRHKFEGIEVLEY